MDKEDKKILLQDFPKILRENADVTMRYQAYLQIVNDYLMTIYGEYADWARCIDEYFKSDYYNKNYHYVHNCEEIPLLNGNDIENMIKQEEQYSSRVAELLSISEKTDNYKGTDITHTIARILGIHPDISNNSLYNWIISREYLNSDQYNQVKSNFEKNQNLINLAGIVLSDLFRNGFCLEFPVVGRVMIQQKGRYYFRGENAYYGVSKPGIYRGLKEHTIPQYVQAAIEILRYYECWNLLDRFDAVKRWGNSSVNYMALSQHYGLKTKMMDVTSDLKTALFFACCKWGDDQRWHPLKRDEIEHVDSREYVSSIGGDSRYGIIYRCPTEINDMKWAISDEKVGLNIIIPVGYQPFMRCSQQYGYMLMIDDQDYDMMQDPLFDKFKIRLDEDFCLWIYEEMDKGKAIYPHADIPNIEQYITPINKQNCFSEETFKTFVEGVRVNSNGEKRLRKSLQGYGYYIIPQISHLSDQELNTINKIYDVEVACSKIGIQAVSRPIYTFPTATLNEFLSREYNSNAQI